MQRFGGNGFVRVEFEEGKISVIADFDAALEWNSEPLRHLRAGDCSDLRARNPRPFASCRVEQQRQEMLAS